MKEEIKIGDIVLVKTFGSNIFGAEILGIKEGWFGKRYIAEWTVYNPWGENYKTVGFLRSWNIL